jgi:hypothetical protein
LILLAPGAALSHGRSPSVLWAYDEAQSAVDPEGRWEEHDEIKQGEDNEFIFPE